MRLRPYTSRLPKPLVPIGDDLTMIEVLFRQLRAQGFTEVSLALGHMGELIEAFVGDGSRWDLRVDCWHEDQPLGTAGPLLHHRDDLPDHFVVLNSDLLCEIDLDVMLRQHVASEATLTMAASSRQVRVDFGVVGVDGGRLAGFQEKPELGFQVNMGIYCLSRSLLGTGEPRALGFDDLMKTLLAEGDAPHVFSFDGYWLDIGRPDDYDRANRDFPTLREKLWRLKPAHPAPLEEAPTAEVIDLRAGDGDLVPTGGLVVEVGHQNGSGGTNAAASTR